MCSSTAHEAGQYCLQRGSHAQVDISEDAAAATSDGTISADFTYSVKWSESPMPFEKRMDKYRKYQLMPQHLEVWRVCVCE